MKYIDARVPLPWLATAAAAIVVSYVSLQSRVGQLTDAMTEIKQDRAAWIAQNERMVSEMRQMAATDAVQTTRISAIEASIDSLRRETQRREK